MATHRMLGLGSQEAETYKAVTSPKETHQYCWAGFLPLPHCSSSSPHFPAWGADPARPRPVGPTFLSGFPGLLMGRPRGSSILLGQMLSKARRPAAVAPHSCILPPGPLQARSPAPTSRRRRPGPGWRLYTQRSGGSEAGQKSGRRVVGVGLRNYSRGEEGGPGGERGTPRGRGGSRRSARGGAFSPGQSALWSK